MLFVIELPTLALEAPGVTGRRTVSGAEIIAKRMRDDDGDQLINGAIERAREFRQGEEFS